MPTADRTPHRPTAAEYRDRDLAALRHVYRYGIGLNATVSRAICGGKEAGHVLRRFSDRNWLTMHSATIPGGITYATLTAQGAKEIGREEKTKKLGAVALDTAISVAFYALLAEKNVRRRRLTVDEIKQLACGLATNTPHVLTEEFGEPVVLRVQSASSGRPGAVSERVERFFEKASTGKLTAPWIRTKDLGLVLLGHTPERVEQLKNELTKDSRFENVRLAIGLGPTAETLATCLRERRKTNQ